MIFFSYMRFRFCPAKILNQSFIYFIKLNPYSFILFTKMFLNIKLIGLILNTTVYYHIVYCVCIQSWKTLFCLIKSPLDSPFSVVENLITHKLHPCFLQINLMLNFMIAFWTTNNQLSLGFSKFCLLKIKFHTIFQACFIRYHYFVFNHVLKLVELNLNILINPD